MRVMEAGVQRLGKKLGISLANEKNWQNILDEVNKAVKALPSKTTRQKNICAIYSEAAAYLFNVKQAWRNPTMHPKKTYTEEQAGGIINSVKTFMNHFDANL